MPQNAKEAFETTSLGTQNSAYEVIAKWPAESPFLHGPLNSRVTHHGGVVHAATDNRCCGLRR